MAILETRSITWPDEAACALTAQGLASQPAIRRAFIELRGPLGAGKTTFVRHLLQALGVQGRIKSPTYAVMEPYSIEQNGRSTEAWHFDFYRFNDPREWEDAGFREIFASEGLKLAEWPEQADGLLPEPDLRVEIVPLLPARDEASLEADVDESVDVNAETLRTVTFIACTALGLELLP